VTKFSFLPLIVVCIIAASSLSSASGLRALDDEELRSVVGRWNTGECVPGPDGCPISRSCPFWPLNNCDAWDWIGDSYKQQWGAVPGSEPIEWEVVHLCMTCDCQLEIVEGWPMCLIDSHCVNSYPVNSCKEL